jgi:hypothetical protein
MGRSMAHIAHQPGPVCLEGGVSRWLVGVVGLGAELHQRPHTCGAWGASSIRVPKKNARDTVSRPSLGLAGMAELRALFPGRPGGRSKAVAFCNPQALSNVQEENLSCARDQAGGNVVIARPPVLTPPWRYRRSLVSKGRFAISINVVCVCGNPLKPSEKAISRGDRLCRRPPPPPRQGRVLVASWIMTRVRIWENIELSVDFRGCCE